MRGAGQSTLKLEPRSRAEWRTWLAEHHGDSNGVWVVLAKKGAGVPGPSYEEAVEEALCFGWIDSRMHRLDERRFEQWFSPRRAGSIWSQSNKARVDRLRRAGLMEPPGLARVEAAVADGSWGLLDEVEALVVPPDLAASLAAAPEAAAGFAALAPSLQKQYLYWVLSAKRAQTRAARVAAVVAAAPGNPPLSSRG
jgi:uncharacterized protein YdeI (YjbR/CyaY-like superfamily)